MNKVVVLLIKVIAILPFSLPSPSSFLKLPNVSSRPLKKVLWKHRSPKAYFRKFFLSAGVQDSGNVFQSNVCFFLFLLWIWLLSVFSGTAIERWLKNPLSSIWQFFLEFSCCPYYRGVRYSGVSARQELTVQVSKRVPPGDSTGPVLIFLLGMQVSIPTRQVIF